MGDFHFEQNVFNCIKTLNLNEIPISVVVSFALFKSSWSLLLYPADNYRSDRSLLSSLDDMFNLLTNQSVSFHYPDLFHIGRTNVYVLFAKWAVLNLRFLVFDNKNIGKSLLCLIKLTVHYIIHYVNGNVCYKKCFKLKMKKCRHTKLHVKKVWSLILSKTR